MLRLYILENCPHCHNAEQYLRENGIPLETIIPRNDPIILTGLAVAFPGQPAQFPILVNYRDNELIPGFQKDKYERVVRAYTSLPLPSLPHGSIAPQQLGGEASPVAQELTPQTQ